MLEAMTALLSLPLVISHRFSRSLMTVTRNRFSCSSSIEPLMEPIAQHKVFRPFQDSSRPFCRVDYMRTARDPLLSTVGIWAELIGLHKCKCRMCLTTVNAAGTVHAHNWSVLCFCKTASLAGLQLGSWTNPNNPNPTDQVITKVQVNTTMDASKIWYGGSHAARSILAKQQM